jgi:hypothetical protein
MASPVRRAAVASAGALSETIDKALSAAARRHDIRVESSNLRGPGRIRLVHGSDINAAFSAAVLDVTAPANVPNGIDARPTRPLPDIP